MSSFTTEEQTFYLACWRDTLTQLNNSTEDDIIQACKDHLTYMKSFTWFTDGITAAELTEINTALA